MTFTEQSKIYYFKMTTFYVIDNFYPDSYIDTEKLIPNALDTSDVYFLLLAIFHDKYKALLTRNLKVTGFLGGTLDLFHTF